MENVRKQTDKEKREVLRFAASGLLRRLLPILDELELALISMKDRDDDFADGVRMTFQNLLRTLQAEGLEEIPAEAEPFDPYVHEAVGFAESDTEEGVVVEVRVKGYRMQDRVLRPAQVVVSRRGGEDRG